MIKSNNVSNAPVPSGRLARWLLGSERRRRGDLLFTLTAIAVYCFSLLALWQAALAGMVSVDMAKMLTLTIVSVQLTIYVVIRSGVTRNLGDPGLLFVQMVVAIVLIAWAYVINVELNGMLLMLVALVLSFSALSLSPRMCIGIGVFAFLVFAVVIVAAVELAPQDFPPQKAYNHLAFLAVVLPTLSFIGSRVSRMRLQLKQQRRELRASLESIEKIATSDELTGLRNRRYVNAWLLSQVAQSQRLGVTVCIALIDIDHFKRVNDKCGHSVGDEVLRAFAAIARSVVREGEVFARWGGEEFLWVMVGANPQSALHAVERLRALVSQSPQWAIQPGWPMSFSAGIAALDAGKGVEVALRDADDALYLAKAEGRARTRVH